MVAHAENPALRLHDSLSPVTPAPGDLTLSDLQEHCLHLVHILAYTQANNHTHSIIISFSRVVNFGKIHEAT